MSDIQYRIGESRYHMAFLEGFEIKENRLEPMESTSLCVFLKPLDAGESEAEWGRLKFSAKTSEDSTYYVYLAASDQILSPQKETKTGYRRFLQEELHASRYVGQNDILLYGLKGRYLYIGIEAISSDLPELTISDMVVDRIGDQFMSLFPRVYQERDSFFHRYMSIFSSLYNDLGEEIDRLPQLLDLDHCQSELLPIYASWLGIDIGDGFLEEDVLRTLVKEAYELCHMKGTRYCLERITEIILGEKGILVERNQLDDLVEGRQDPLYMRLYGKSSYDVTLLLKKHVSQTKRSQLLYILKQFLPVRCDLNIIEMQEGAYLDRHNYLDINVKTQEVEGATLDGNGYSDGAFILR